jgi:hypothetical protein
VTRKGVDMHQLSEFQHEYLRNAIACCGGIALLGGANAADTAEEAATRQQRASDVNALIDMGLLTEATESFAYDVSVMQAIADGRTVRVTRLTNVGRAMFEESNGRKAQVN